jgi:hypothetical protein
MNKGQVFPYGAEADCKSAVVTGSLGSTPSLPTNLLPIAAGIIGAVAFILGTAGIYLRWFL